MPPNQIWQIVVFIIGTIAVIFAAYYVSYYLGKKTMTTGSGRNIRLRDRFAVSKDKSFYLLEVNGKIYFVAAANQSVTLLDTYPAEDFTGDFAETRPGFRTQSAPRAGAQAASPAQGNGPAAVIQNAITRAVSRTTSAVNRRSRSLIHDLDRRITLQTAQEEDSLDIVYRQMQARRASQKSPPPEEGGE